MSLTFPLPIEQFFAGLQISSAKPDLPRAAQSTRTAGGDVISASLGARLWTMDVTVPRRSFRISEEVRAMVHVLREAGGSLLAHAKPGWAPAADPDGSILGAANPTLASVASNNRDITLAGLPEGYQLTRGDYLSFTYGNTPTRYAFHQVVTAGIAGADGTIGPIEVTPFVRPGAAVGAPVKLVRPVFKAVLVDSDTGTAMRTYYDGITLKLQQTLR